jgi:hypothetical protein
VSSAASTAKTARARARTISPQVPTPNE